MARTFPLRAPFNSTGIPWGPRSTNTGDPNTGSPAIPAVPELNDCTLSGVPQAYNAGSPGTPAVVDKWHIPIGMGTLTDGDIFEVTVAGGPSSPYTSTYHTGDTPMDVFAPITAAILADGQYTGTLDLVGPAYNLEAVAAGAGHVVTGSTTSVGITFGPAVNTQVGADAIAPVPATAATVASMTDGTHTYSVTYTAGTLDDLATALAAAVDGHDGYSATAAGAVVSTSGPAGYVLTDLSINGVTIAVVVTQVGNPYVPAIGNLDVNSPYVMSLAAVTDVALWCKLVSGTGCTVVPWFYDPISGTWTAQTPVVITADKVIQLAVPAIRCLYVEQKTFVGGGIVTVTCVGNSTHPSAN